LNNDRVSMPTPKLRTAGLALVAAALIEGTALAGDGLAPPPPGRLVVRSEDRVSDGRKLQRDADGSLRKAEVPSDAVAKQEDPPADRTAPAPTGDRAHRD
jgi:hypothetical protein